jgi:hypothetical protein
VISRTAASCQESAKRSSSKKPRITYNQQPRWDADLADQGNIKRTGEQQKTPGKEAAKASGTLDRGQVKISLVPRF